jgi:hypothetical protein
LSLGCWAWYLAQTAPLIRQRGHADATETAALESDCWPLLAAAGWLHCPARRGRVDLSTRQLVSLRVRCPPAAHLLPREERHAAQARLKQAPRCLSKKANVSKCLCGLSLIPSSALLQPGRPATAALGQSLLAPASFLVPHSSRPSYPSTGTRPAPVPTVDHYSWRSAELPPPTVLPLTRPAFHPLTHPAVTTTPRPLLGANHPRLLVLITQLLGNKSTDVAHQWPDPASQLPDSVLQLPGAVLQLPGAVHQLADTIIRTSTPAEPRTSQPLSQLASPSRARTALCHAQPPTPCSAWLHAPSAKPSLLNSTTPPCPLACIFSDWLQC